LKKSEKNKDMMIFRVLLWRKCWREAVIKRMESKTYFTKQLLISELQSYRQSYRVDPNDPIIMVRSVEEDAVTPHNHDFYELVYIESGRGVHVVNDTSMLVSAGDMFMIKLEDTHALYPLTKTDQPFQWITCVFSPEYIEMDVSPFVSERKYFGTDGYEVDFIFRMMFKEYLVKETGYMDKLKWYLLILLSEIARFDSNAKETVSYTAVKKQMIVKKTIHWLHQHYMNKIKIEEISAHFSLSASYISRMFKECTGLSIVQYINQYRLEQSCKLLTESTHSIRKIVKLSGFQDEKFYRRYFHKHLGITPGEFRNKRNFTNPQVTTSPLLSYPEP
jgi:AraC-like DNA-binding protein/mannose-6-phosphate isomerase-like protein (cupin superfamily)